MKEFWNMIQLVFAGLGGWLGWFLGGCDGLIYALLVFVVVDYVTGVLCAISDRALSSEVSFRGLCRKVLIFMLVAIGHILDVYVIGIGAAAVYARLGPSDGRDILLHVERGHLAP